MDQSHKLEKLLTLLADGIHAALTEDPAVTTSLATITDQNVTQRLAERDLSGLKAYINAATMCELLQHIKLCLIADGSVDLAEMNAVRDLLQHSSYRLKDMPGFADFAGLSDAGQVAELLQRWEKDKGDFGGGRESAVEALMLNGLALLASAIRRNTELYDTYTASTGVVVRMIAGVGGIQGKEQVYIDGLATYQNAMRDNVLTQLTKLRGEAQPGPAAGLRKEPDGSAPSPGDALAQAMQELQSLIGIQGVKAEVTKLSNFLKIRRQRLQSGLPAATQSLHFVFTGNPGTGKTTVARIVSKLLYGFEILKTNNLKEADRSALVGGYLGQTAIKTTEVIDAANNGVLFIDEAYTLTPKTSHGDQYGQEAVDTLLKKMEDLRDSLVVIAAGYPDRMKEFLSANPGLESRFTRFINFDDYNVAELCQIYEGMCRKNSYSLTAPARGKAFLLFYSAYSQRDEKFGNARFVRNVFEKTLGNHSDRLAAHDGEISREMLSTIEAADIPFEVADEAALAAALASAQWRAKCPKCEKEFTKGCDFVGHRVTCKCGCRFVFPWWNLVPADYFVSAHGYVPSDNDTDLYGVASEGAAE